MKTDLFQSCGHCWVFQICWHIECITLTASSFRIWNSSTGIPSPPLTLFIVMIPKAHLTSHSRMSGSRWVITPSWLPGSWRSFLYSSVYFCHLFLILVVASNPRQSLACGSITPISAYFLSCPSFICVCVQIPLLKGHQSLDYGPNRNIVWPHSNLYTSIKTLFPK